MLGIFRGKKWAIVGLAAVLLLIATWFVLTRFFVAYAEGFISRGMLAVRLSHVQFAYDLQTKGTPAEDSGYAARAARSILEQLIVEKFLLLEAGERGVAVTSEEKAAHVEAVVEWIERQHFDGARAAFLEALAARGLTFEDLTEYVADSLVIYRLRSQMAEGIAIAEADLRAFYDANRQGFNLPEMIRLRHILVAEENQATELLRLIRAGGDFAELARKNSRDVVSAELGGDLNWRQRGAFVEAFDNAAWALVNVNDVSPVIKTLHGYHIIRLEGKLPPRERSFSEVRELVRERLRDEREADLWQTYLTELRRRHRIIIFLH